MQVTSQNILGAFSRLPETEKHAVASEIIKQVALLDFLPLTDEALTEIADALFIEHDKKELDMSTKLTIKEAVEIIPVSESSLRRDFKSGRYHLKKTFKGGDVSTFQNWDVFMDN